MSHRMDARVFGRLMKAAFELPPLPAGAQPKPPAPPPPAPAPAANKTPTWSNFWTGDYKPANPTAYEDYRRTLSRYVSPWNNDTSGADGGDRDYIDSALKWGTRGALGVGAAAGTAAAGVAAAGALGSSTAAGGVATTAAAGSQTPAGQNIMQRGAQTAGQFGSQIGNLYQNTIDPTLKRVGYSPEGALQDAYAAGTGHFDQIKGPGWAGVKMPAMPVGAPTIPKPLDVVKGVTKTISPLLGAGVH